MKSRAPVLRWSALRDKKTPLKEVTESFLVHRHDLSPATQDNYRLQFRLYDGWVAAQLGRPTRVEDVEPGTVNAYLEHRRSTISEWREFDSGIGGRLPTQRVVLLFNADSTGVWYWKTAIFNYSD